MLPTSRLTLRRFVEADAPDVQRLAGAREVAMNTLLIPHPYPEGAAEAWIAGQKERWDSGETVVFAIDAGGQLTGAVGMQVTREHDRAELGYWIGMPFWGRGYATEASAEMLRYGFETMALNRIFASHFSRNAASGRVLQKIGMRYEGSMPQQYKKWGQYVDIDCYGILRSDWEKR